MPAYIHMMMKKKEGMVTDPELLYNLYIITRWIGKKKFVWNLTFVPVGPLSALLVTAVTVRGADLPISK